MLSILSWALFAGGLLITIAFLAETAVGLLPLRPRSATGRQDGSFGREELSGVIVVPAHNEASGIGRSLSELQAQVPAGFEILVVADNCTDDTAAIARKLGVAVIERHDHAHRGKGYALAHARDFLRKGKPACVIVLDADCSIDRGSIKELAREVHFGAAAAQARYLLRPLPAASPLTQISTFAFMIKNFIRQRGLQQLRAPAILTGSGMAFPWHIFDRRSLGAGTLAEDLELAVHLVREGHSPVYCDTAEVWSDPAPDSALVDQRGRWEGGVLAMAASNSLPLLIGGLARFSWPRVWMSLHLFVPPLTLLLFLHVSILAATTALHAMGATLSPMLLEFILLTLLAILLATTWLVHGRRFVSWTGLMRVPFYIFWKVPLYWRLVWRREARWTRTERR